MTPKSTLQITLTAQQQEQLRKATGKPIASLKLEALDERVLPALCLN